MHPTKLSRTLAIAAACAISVFAIAQDNVPDNIKAAVKKADDAVAAIVAVPDNQRNFDNTIGAIDDLSVRLDDDTSMFIFMQNVSTDPKVRDEARAADEYISNWASALNKREDLYKA